MEDQYFKDIPIVALTASVMSNVLEKTREVGMNGYVSKPFDPNDLKDTIVRHTDSFLEGYKTPGSTIKTISDPFPYLTELMGSDHEAISEIVKSSISSVENASEGIKEGIKNSDLKKIKQDLHVLRPNLHNLELGRLVNGLETVNELNKTVFTLLDELLANIDKVLNEEPYKSNRS
jgi:CheY-like chemotaxis protein